MSSDQKQLKVAIQGVKASFHDVAARNYFAGRNLMPVECATFRQLCDVLKNGEADLALMAIENSIAGSILTNYTLLENYQFKISGEVYLRIEMSLMGLPGQKNSELEYVQSHPMALLQCEEFLNSHPQLKAIEGTDTADSAKQIATKGLKGWSAIANHLAAETYGLEVFAKGIETNKQNYTRFLVITRVDSPHFSATDPQTKNKSSVRFQISHQPGSLVDLLMILKTHSINMTKIQSVPILGKPYEYAFHVDLEWNDKESHDRALDLIQKHAIGFIHFGDYPKGVRPQAL